MFCPKCGAANNDANMNCTNCGAPLRSAQPKPSYPQQPAPQPRPIPQAQPTQGNYYPPQPPATAFNFYNFWYKFMSYAGFFLMAGGMFFLGLGQLIGWQYCEDGIDFVKMSVGGLRAADIITGILFMLLAVFAVYAWFQFRYLRFRAPMLTYVLFGGAAGLYIVYFIIEIIVLSTSKAVKYVGATKLFPIVFPIILMVILIALVAAWVYYFKTEKPRFVYYPQPKQAPAYPQNNQYNYQQNNQPVNYNQNNQNNPYQ